MSQMNGHAEPTRPPLIAIGVPSYDMVCAEFAQSLALLCGRLGWEHIPFAIYSARNSRVAAGRNRCVEQAQQDCADYMFFIDSDMIVPSDAVHALLARNKPIVGALYRRRGPPFDMMGMGLVPGSMTVPGGVFEMRTIPTGCMLIDMAVFRKLERPYFHHRIRDGEDTEDGEDYVFCEEAREAGFSVWADIDLSYQVKHIGFQHIGVNFTPPPPADGYQAHTATA